MSNSTRQGNKGEKQVRKVLASLGISNNVTRFSALDAKEPIVVNLK